MLVYQRVPPRLATWATDDIVGSHSITCDRHWVESEECHLTIDHRTESLNPDRGTIWNNSCWFKWGTPKIEWFFILFPPKMTILIKWFIIIFPPKMVYHPLPSNHSLQKCKFWPSHSLETACKIGSSESHDETSVDPQKTITAMDVD